MPFLDDSLGENLCVLLLDLLGVVTMMLAVGVVLLVENECVQHKDMCCWLFA